MFKSERYHELENASMKIQCHFDGKVLVPDEPLDLPVNQPLSVNVVADATIIGSSTGKTMTGRELAKSRVVGIWAKRADIGDSTKFARALRRRADPIVE